MAKMTVCDHCNKVIKEGEEAIASVKIGMGTVTADLCEQCGSYLCWWLLGEQGPEGPEGKYE